MALNAATGSDQANSYVTLEFAYDYFFNHVLGISWVESSKQSQALIQATRLLDSLIKWSGVRATDTQALEWPRVVEIDDIGVSTIPVSLKYAVCELAMYLITNPASTGITLTDDSVSSVKVGPITVDLNNDRPTVVLPHIVSSMVAHLGSMKNGFGGSISQPKLVRV